jgi:hypothetical protein
MIGKSMGVQMELSTLEIHALSTIPAAPPTKASSTFSVSNCRISRPRTAPRALRTAISLSRAFARARRILARLTQATSRTIKANARKIPTMAGQTPAASGWGRARHSG